MSRRVVITGRGIVSCIGNTLDEVAGALRHGRSGIVRLSEFAEAGLRSEHEAAHTGWIKRWRGERGI